MDIALCYERVIPARGGAETYICDLARRLVRDGHAVHLYACEWDAAALPPAMHYHRLPRCGGPRWLRPWRFGHACLDALRHRQHDLSIGFDKTWGQDILYPQGGLHAASAAHNLLKFRRPLQRWLAWLGKRLDPAYWSFCWLERQQYLGPHAPLIVVNSRMVQRHFEQYYQIPAERIRVVPAAIDPERFAAEDRLRRRHEERQRWGVSPEGVVALFVAMNYRLKGLGPLLEAMARVRQEPLYLAVVGHPRYQAYQRRAVRLGIAGRVRFLGHRPDPRDCFFAADFLVHPTFYDPCSLVVLEALCCGLPVLTTRYNGAAELFATPEEGLVIDDPHDHDQFAAALMQMAERQYLRRASQAARARALQWTFDHHYQALLNVFQEVCRQRQAA